MTEITVGIEFTLPKSYATEASESVLDSFEGGEFEPHRLETITDETARVTMAQLVCALGKSLGREDEIHQGIKDHTQQMPSTRNEVMA